MLCAVIFLLTVFVSGSHQQCFSSNDTAPFLSTDKYYSWLESQHEFSLSLLKYLNKGKGNVIFSPSSVYEVLMLAYFGAAHGTEASISKALPMHEYLDKAQFWRSFRNEKLIYSGSKMSNFPMKIANKIFLNDKFTLRPCVKENLENQIELIDYKRNPLWTKKYINDWISDVTEGKIKDLIKHLDSKTTATIVNAIYLKVKWQHQFNPNNTQYLPFRVNSKLSKTTNMMVETGNFLVDREDDVGARVLKLLYEGSRLAMVILLPDGHLDTMIQKMNTNTIRLLLHANIFNQSSFVKVIIPKFEQRNNFDLHEAMEQLGFGEILSTGADFSRFTGKKEVFFNEMTHEAVIEVNEEGTTAAAATEMATFLSAHIPSEPFICDRPFAYLIYDHFTSKIIFMGTFRDVETN